MGKHSFLFLGANTPWTYSLAEALAQHYPTHATDFYDWLTYYRLKPRWPTNRVPPPLLTRSINKLPNGYAGKLESLLQFYLRYLVQKWCQQIKRISGKHPWVIAAHPVVVPWIYKVPSELLIYYNFDDYIVSRPGYERKLLEQEKTLIERASIILCSSYAQVLTFQKRHPHKSSHIYHYPHGVAHFFVNPKPEENLIRGTVGYFGNLTERVNWQLVYKVTKACPEIKFIFVGSLNREKSPSQENWQVTREAVFALPNVYHHQGVPNDQAPQHYWSFAVNWIPYVIDNQFNQASCPTKIMDGIASGRPILSTDIPECRLYPEWITIFHSAEDAIAKVREQMAFSEKPESYEKTLNQLQFAQKQTWQFRVQTLECILSQI